MGENSTPKCGFIELPPSYAIHNFFYNYAAAPLASVRKFKTTKYLFQPVLPVFCLSHLQTIVSLRAIQNELQYSSCHVGSSSLQGCAFFSQRTNIMSVTQLRCYSNECARSTFKLQTYNMYMHFSSPVSNNVLNSFFLCYFFRLSRLFKIKLALF